MKAVILCAGEGERLRPLTLTTPKPLLPIGDRPLIEHTIDWLVDYGINELCINLHHLGDEIERHLGDGSRWGVHITYSHEQILLGTAGALRLAYEWMWAPADRRVVPGNENQKTDMTGGWTALSLAWEVPWIE